MINILNCTFETFIHKVLCKFRSRTSSHQQRATMSGCNFALSYLTLKLHLTAINKLEFAYTSSPHCESASTLVVYCRVILLMCSHSTLKHCYFVVLRGILLFYFSTLQFFFYQLCTCCTFCMLVLKTSAALPAGFYIIDVFEEFYTI